MAVTSCLRASSKSPKCHSNLADFMRTRGVGAELRALAKSFRALSYSQFSDSNLTAANQISSEFGFAWKARERMDRAAGTSPEN